MKRSFFSLLLLICLCGCSFQTKDITEYGNPGFPLKVMSYNIHVAKGMDGKFSLERIADEILGSGADVAGLQEVDRFTLRNPLDEMKKLEELTGYYGVFSRNLDFQGGEYGIAILSRYPIVDHRSIHFPVTGDMEPRGALAVKSEPPDGPAFWVVTTHLGTDKTGREQLNQVNFMKKWLYKIDDGAPFIITGDFNREPETETILEMGEEYEDLWLIAGEGNGFTFNVKEPSRRIDYIFIKPEHLKKCMNIKVPETNGSDHRPVVAEIIITSKISTFSD